MIRIFIKHENIWRRLIAREQVHSFAEKGINVVVGNYCDFIPSHIHIGNNVRPSPIFYCKYSPYIH